ncbi:MAG TPA: HNH endonuclease signature motif containing protein, partial [Candidatus Hydrogenedentes bacterium]|nr:HNH endonuclease signature motif containing protein [Candidatus Hydrogenedentota bacterium]
DTAEVIRLRHSFLLSQLYSRIRITPRDPNRRFDALEKEVIWNRDRALCQHPNCQRPNRRLPFREATIHHVIEHTAGGNTALQNGVLICPECHADRGEMQRLTTHFQDYLRRIYASPTLQLGSDVVPESPTGADSGASDANDDAAETRAAAGKLKIVIDWGALDVDRETQTIAEDQDSKTIVKLLVELIGVFGEFMKQQLMEFPVIRFPLSKNPDAFLNRVRGTRYNSIQVPGTDLFFCPHSQRTEKAERLKTLFSRLTLRDGRGFPPDSIDISIAAVPAAQS